MKDTQVDRTLRFMVENGSITSLQAISEFGCTRLADVIFKIRRRGIDVKTETISVKNRYGETAHVARYSLA